MAYDEILANRIREAFSHLPNVEEKKMMGGLTFMVNGKMCVGVIKDGLMCRIDPDEYERALEINGCREMNFTGRPMKGFVIVGQEALIKKKDFEYWIDLSLKYNPKAKASPKRKKE